MAHGIRQCHVVSRPQWDRTTGCYAPSVTWSIPTRSQIGDVAPRVNHSGPNDHLPHHHEHKGFDHPPNRPRVTDRKHSWKLGISWNSSFLVNGERRGPKRVGESYRLHIRKEVTGYDACSNHLIAIYSKRKHFTISCQETAEDHRSLEQNFLQGVLDILQRNHIFHS